MTTARQAAIVTELLRANNPDVVLVGRRLVVMPLEHVLRSIWIDRVSNAQAFQIHWHANHLFKSGPFGGNWGQDIYCPAGGGWRWDIPDLPELVESAISESVLPALRAVKSIKDYIGLVNCIEDNRYAKWEDIEKALTSPKMQVWSADGYPRRYPEERVIVAAALGELDIAREYCERLESLRGSWQFNYLKDEYEFVLENLKPLLGKNDHGAIAAFLHELERSKAKAYKLEKIWQPTPFPLEEMG